MTRIPFIDAQFPKRPMSRMAMEHHLLNHLRAVRATKKPDPLPNKDAGGPDEWPDTPMHAAKDGPARFTGFVLTCPGSGGC